MKYLLHGEETQRLYFRSIKESDFEVWLEFHKNPKNHIYWNDVAREIPEIECEKWYEKQFHRYKNNLGGMNALIEKESGKLIGHCGLLVQTVDNALELEVGYSLLPQFWNKGFATEAAQKCRNYAFENNFTETLISIISYANIPSQKVALRNGMTEDKRTIYNNNEVIIFRITKTKWKYMYP